MFEATPAAPVLLADHRYDADWFRQALAARGTPGYSGVADTKLGGGRRHYR